MCMCVEQYLFVFTCPCLRLYYKMQALCTPNRAVSTVHALVVGLFCLYILLFDEDIKRDPVW